MSDESHKSDKKLTGMLWIISLILIISITIVGGIGYLGYRGLKELKANFYYNQAVREKDKGYVYEAKDLLNKAIIEDKKGNIAKKAKIYLKTKLPVSKNITRNSIDLNIKGYNSAVNKQYQQAETYFIQAIEDSPDFEWPYSNLGKLYFYNLNQKDKSIENYSKALNINPDYFNARIGLANIYWSMAREKIKEKNYKEALKLLKISKKHYKKALDSDPLAVNTKKDLNDLNEYLELVNLKLKNKD